MKKILDYILTPIIGLTVTLLITGPRVLDPTYIDWLLNGDSMQHYLGWAFFRQTAWNMPIGLNPNFGLDIGSSIVYSDSIPILAIFFKIIQKFISSPFQYFGIWVFICITLQFWFAQKIISIFTSDKLVAFLAAGIFLYSPLMMWRIGHHSALVAHFLILVSIFLTLNKDTVGIQWKWALLLSITILVHFYLFSMVGALWIASILDRSTSFKRLQIIKLILEFCLIICLLALISWQVGYWAVSTQSASASGYGDFQLNLLSPISPMGWSQFTFMPVIKYPIFDSFNYMGLGAILTLIIGFLLSWKYKYPIYNFLEQKKCFSICLLSFMLFSISNKINIGDISYTLSLPDKVMTYLNILRNSSRFFWPIFYSLLTGSIYLIIKKFNNRKFLVFIFSSLLAIQIYDTSSGWLNLRTKLNSDFVPEFGAPLKNIFWKEAAKKYKRVLIIPSEYSWNWGVFASYAAQYNLGTNSAYMARRNVSGVEKQNRDFTEMLKSGNYDPESLYIIDEWKYFPQEFKYDRSKDLLAKVDGFNILAPNWKRCDECLKVSKNLEIDSWIPLDLTKQEIYFHEGSMARKLMLAYGWPGSGENWGTWAASDVASLVIPMPSNIKKNSHLIIKLRALIGGPLKSQRLEIFMNAKSIGVYELNQFDNNELVLTIPDELLEKKFIVVNLHSLTSSTPKAIGISSDDDRRLSVGLKSLKIQ